MRLARYLIIVILLLATLGLGMAIGVLLRTSGVYRPEIPIQVDEKETPLWPSSDQVKAVKVDMSLWIVPRHNGQHCRCELSASDTDPERRKAFAIQLTCLHESAVTTTAIAGEPTGKIELILQDNQTLRLNTYRHGYIALDYGGNHKYMIYDGLMFENVVWHHGKHDPEPYGR